MFTLFPYSLSLPYYGIWLYHHCWSNWYSEIVIYDHVNIIHCWAIQYYMIKFFLFSIFSQGNNRWLKKLHKQETNLLLICPLTDRTVSTCLNILMNTCIWMFSITSVPFSLAWSGSLHSLSICWLDGKGRWPMNMLVDRRKLDRAQYLTAICPRATKNFSVQKELLTSL